MSILTRSCKKVFALIKINGLNLFRPHTEIDARCNLSNLCIRGAGAIKLSRGVSFRSGCIVNVAEGGKILISEDCFLNDMCLINARESITIGSRCMIGQCVCMYDHDHDYHTLKDMRNTFLTEEIVIGDDVWIGSNVTILRGSKIGDRCVIGAGAIVKGRFPADSMIYADKELVIKPLIREER